MLNFSDDQSGRPEKAAFLWKWLMEHIKNKKEKADNLSVGHSKIPYDALQKSISQIVRGGVHLGSTRLPSIRTDSFNPLLALSNGAAIGQCCLGTKKRKQDF